MVSKRTQPWYLRLQKLAVVLVSTVFLFGTAPSFFVLWGSWRFLSIFLTDRWYQIGDDFLYSLYQRLVLFFYQHFAKIKIVLYGDIEEINRKKENVIFICNHQSTFDWLVADVLAIQQGSIGHIRYILKDVLKWVPLYGFYFRQHNCIYVKRGRKFEVEQAEKQLYQLVRHSIPFWMVLFPEGTRFNPRNQDVIESSQDYARKHDLPVLQHLLTPRLRGLQLTLRKLRANTDAIYDVTVAFSNTKDLKTNQRLVAPGLIAFLKGNWQLHIHVKRIDIKAVPETDEGLGKWLNERYQQKDKILKRFYSVDTAVSETLTDDRKHSQPPLSQTLPVFLFWCIFNIPLLVTHFGHAFYWQSSLFCTIVGWVWVLVFAA
ncbi:1-acyl-sn-glycerol-3-phosphate acyltransferase epsilon [Lamellibrachia satsuma]|nr:1-acyl-sn-glycerol-3-phosphate acyltransferase epsilon [Lamellibrachia satsuma]